MSNNKRKAFGKTLRTILLAAFAAVFAFSAYKVSITLIGEKRSKQLVHDLQKEVVTEIDLPKEAAAEIRAGDEKGEPQSSSGAEDDNETKETEERCPIAVDFETIEAEYPDIVAWIYCPDTLFSYPIVQGPDNQFYLERLLNGEYNAAGTLFADYRNLGDFSDRNTVIYGHNMVNGTMFGILPKYKEQEYYDNYPVMYLLTADHNYKMELFASFITPSDSDIYNLPMDENSFEARVSEFIDLSDFTSEVRIESGDSLVTLSTCSYEYYGARRVVIGVLKEIR